jgi:hypothetical protein
VLRTQGPESESLSAFAALHRLLRPVVALLDGLLVPQARALPVASGHDDGPVVEPFLVTVATLSRPPRRPATSSFTRTGVTSRGELVQLDLA